MHAIIYILLKAEGLKVYIWTESVKKNSTKVIELLANQNQIVLIYSDSQWLSEARRKMFRGKVSLWDWWKKKTSEELKK